MRLPLFCFPATGKEIRTQCSDADLSVTVLRSYDSLMVENHTLNPN